MIRCPIKNHLKQVQAHLYLILLISTRKQKLDLYN